MREVKKDPPTVSSRTKDYGVEAVWIESSDSKSTCSSITDRRSIHDRIKMFENKSVASAVAEESIVNASNDDTSRAKNTQASPSSIPRSGSKDCNDLSSPNNKSGVTKDPSYYSWVQKVQQTHEKEQREMLRGLLTQHVRWQTANRHVGLLLASSRAALEATTDDQISCAFSDFDGNSTFGECLLQYTSVSISAKRYMDELIAKTGRVDMLEIQQQDLQSILSAMSNESFDSTDDVNNSSRTNRSITVPSNPWLRNAALWEQLWSSFLLAKTSSFQLYQSTILKLFSGIMPGGSTTAIAKSSNNISSHSAADAVSSYWGLPSIFRLKETKTDTTTSTDA